MAETEHLPAAGEELHVSASALSRTIRLLEEDVGQPLFTRTGRSLQLNEAGEKFLSRVRDAMRLVHTGIAELSDGALVGSVKVVCGEPFASLYLAEAFAEMAGPHPGLIPYRERLDRDEDPTSALLQGQVDLVLSHQAEPHDDISIRRLCSFETAIYCGRQHPLFRQQPSQAELLEHAFVVPPRASDDGFPPELDRKTGARAEGLLADHLCRTGRFVAVLPRATAERERGELHRLEAIRSAALPWFALMRRPLGYTGRAEAVIEALAPLLPDTPPAT